MAPVFLVGAIVIAAGCVLIWVAVISWQGRLDRSRPVGVRTPSTVRSDEAFAVANKAAAPYAGAGGGVMILGAALAMVVPKHLFGLPLFSGVLIGLAVLLTGAAVGVRACKQPHSVLVEWPGAGQELQQPGGGRGQRAVGPPGKADDPLGVGGGEVDADGAGDAGEPLGQDRHP
jgi:hypothetical protein